MPDINLSLFLGFLGSLMLLGVAAHADYEEMKRNRRDHD